MVKFLNEKYKDQVKQAIDKRDLKLLQILLGPRYCQLWQYWLVRSIFSYDMLSMVRTIKCQLPIDITQRQIHILDNPETNIRIVNASLKEAENKIFDVYRTCINLNHVSQDKVFIAPKPTVSTSNIDPVLELEPACAGAVANFNRDSLKPVLELGFTDACYEMLTEIDEEVRLEIKERDSKSQIRRNLSEKQKKLEKQNTKLKSTLDCISNKVIHEIEDDKLTNKKFMASMYDRLLDHYLVNIASKKGNLLYEDIITSDKKERQEGIEEIKDKIKKNSEQCSNSLLASTISYVMDQYEPGTGIMDVVSILVINGAHLTFIDDKFHKSHHKELREFTKKSFFTLMMDANKILFDFELEREDTREENLIKLMSMVPSEAGEFTKSAKALHIPTEIGKQAQRKLLKKLKSFKKEVDSRMEEGVLGRQRGPIYELLYSIKDYFFERNINTSEMDSQYGIIDGKLYECLQVVFLAVATGDDKVIIDYTRKIDKYEDDPEIRELYKILIPILQECERLEEGSWLARKWYYTSRNLSQFSKNLVSNLREFNTR